MTLAVDQAAGLATSTSDLPPAVREVLRQATHLYDTEAWFEIEVAAGSGPELVWATAGDAVACASLYSSADGDPPWPYARPDLFMAELGLSAEPVDGLADGLFMGGRRPGHGTITLTGSGEPRAQCLAILVQRVVQLACERNKKCIVLPFLEPSLARELGGAFTRPCLRSKTSFGWEMHLPGERFEDWISSQDKKGRAREKATMRKCAAFEFRVEHVTDADLDAVVALETQHYHAFGNNYGVEQARNLHLAYGAVLPESSWTITAFDGDVMAGFVSVVKHGHRAWVRQVGIDPEYSDAQLYFGLVYHEAIKWAYENRVHVLDFSISADDAKRRRGCTPVPLESLVCPMGTVRFTAPRGGVPTFA